MLLYMFNLDVVSRTLKVILTVNLNYDIEHNKGLNLGAAAQNILIVVVLNLILQWQALFLLCCIPTQCYTM